MRAGVVSVGRSAESTVPLNDTNVSRRHAEIRSRGEGADMSWILVDLGSTNGTYVNGTQVQSLPLTSGDQIQIGKFRLTFTCQQQGR